MHSNSAAEGSSGVATASVGELTSLYTPNKAQTAAPFVLVHGAWAGGWCWRQVADILRSNYHLVFTPTMTGVGERRHSIGHFTNLDRWVDDVNQVFDAEELSDVILVGHSFGGRVVTGVADRIPDRIRRIVFLDAALPTSGMSLIDELREALGDEAVANRVEMTRSSDGMSLPAPPASVLGVSDAAEQDWVNRRLTPQPFATNTSALYFKEPIGGGRQVSFIKFTDPAFALSARSHAFADAQSGWDVRSIPTGHMGMISAPTHLATALLEIARLR